MRDVGRQPAGAEIVFIAVSLDGQDNVLKCATSSGSIPEQGLQAMQMKPQGQIDVRA